VKTALLVGCGSKFGLEVLTNFLDHDWTVYSLSGSLTDIKNDNLHQEVIDWKTINVANIEKFLNCLPNLDFIFFNQNSSALNQQNFQQNCHSTVDLWKQEKTWSQCYFVSCILPFHIIHSLGDRCDKNTKVGWMLSTYVYFHSDIKNADYIGNKYQNFLMMKNFSKTHPACFFGINPDNLIETNTTDNIENLISMCDDMKYEDLNGLVLKFNKVEDPGFQKFAGHKL